MNVFRISVIVLALSLIAGVVVHIRLKNWHYAYLINQRYDQYQRLQREYSEGRLELARYQSPDNLLERLKELHLPLEGFGLPSGETTGGKKVVKPPVKGATKPPEKPSRNNKKNSN